MANRRYLNVSPRLVLWTVGLAIVTGAVWLMAVTAPADPSVPESTQSESSVIVNSAIIVFREGLEAVLILAAVLASFRGADAMRKRPVVAGAAAAFAAAVATWFVAQALLDVASPLGPRLEAITGFLAIAVLLVVLNWFVHKAYWSQWIGRHHRERRRLLAQTGLAATVGFVMLGFTSVYREGFEVVLFLQNLEIQAGTTAVLAGVGIGLAATAAVGLVTFWLHTRLPYKRILVVTGVMIGGVLVVMIGGTALTFMELGWLPATPTPFGVPEWMGSWFEVYPYWETIGAQVFAAGFVIGSYYLAKYVQGRKPAPRRAVAPAMEMAEVEAPPA